jgi:low affinity Fe/Cu permease
MTEIFRKISNRVSIFAGKAVVFLLAILVVVIWASTGPIFGFSDTWQLIINTGTTIVTFLMVFLIQNTQNRDTKAIQLKLDELIRASKARNAFVDLEDLTDEELAQLDTEFRDIHEKSGASLVMKNLHESIQLEHVRRKSTKGKGRINAFIGRVRQSSHEAAKDE